MTSIPNFRSVQRVLAVVVAYHRQWNQVTSASYLVDELNRKSEQEGEQSHFVLDTVVIYDNSPLPLAKPLCNYSGLKYKHDPENGGTRSAYEYALAVALKAGQEWILLLDQDTSLPTNYLHSLNYSCDINNIDKIDVLLPRVEDHGRSISPARITFLGSIAPLSRISYAAEKGASNITGIASGSLIRTLALSQLPPIPSELWLDYVDHWIFHQMNLRRANISFVDVSLQHELSIMSMSDVSRQRLYSILNGEFLFNQSLGLPARIIYPLRLIIRFVRMSILSQSSAKNMLAWLVLRLQK